MNIKKAGAMSTPINSEHWSFASGCRYIGIFYTLPEHQRNNLRRIVQHIVTNLLSVNFQHHEKDNLGKTIYYHYNTFNYSN